MTPTPATYLCFNGYIGCKKSFPDTAFNRKERLCNPCINTYAFNYGIHPSDIGWITSAGQNMEFYFGQMPGSTQLLFAEKARMIMIAAGVEVKNITDRERDGAAYLKRKYPSLGADNAGEMG